MTTNRVVEPGYVSINGELYRRKASSPVHWFEIDQPPGKVALGEITDESNPLSSTWEITDLRDGLGVLIQDPRTDINRCWWSTCQLRYRGHIVNPRLATTVAVANTTADIGVIGVFKERVFATYGTVLETYATSDDAWTIRVASMLGVATDWAVGLVGGTEHLVVASGSGIDYATAIDAWGTESTYGIKYVVFWDNFLWGITQAGQLYYTDDLTRNAWVADAQLQLPDDYVTGLVVARGPDREEHIYATARTGLHVHDNVNTRFRPTGLTTLPYHPQGGAGKAVFRGAVMYSAGLAIHRIDPSAERAVADLIGPDLRDGLPNNYRGAIVQLVPQSLHELLAVVDATTATSTSTITTRTSGGFGSSRFSTFGSATGRSSILGWDGRGWETKWASTSAARGINAAAIGYAYQTYRLWWAHNQRVLYMDLPIDVTNPTQVSATSYASSATLETPWFDGGVSNMKKLAIELHADSTHPTISDTIKFEYAVHNDDEQLTSLTPTYNEIATKIANGEATYRLPSANDKSGAEFRYIKFRVTFTANVSTATPDLHKMYLVWRKRTDVLFGGRLHLDLTQQTAGVYPSQQSKNLIAARSNGNLVEITWRNDPSEDEPQNYWADILNLQFGDESGEMSVPAGEAIVEFGEPVPSTGR